MFSGGRDRVTDLDARDVIDVAQVAAITGLRDLLNNHATSTAGGVVIDDGAGRSLLLAGVALADLRASDFDF